MYSRGVGLKGWIQKYETTFSLINKPEASFGCRHYEGCGLLITQKKTITQARDLSKCRYVDIQPHYDIQIPQDANGSILFLIISLPPGRERDVMSLGGGGLPPNAGSI